MGIDEARYWLLLTIELAAMLALRRKFVVDKILSKIMYYREEYTV